jgi:hypothetical protein
LHIRGNVLAVAPVGVAQVAQMTDELISAIAESIVVLMGVFLFIGVAAHFVSTDGNRRAQQRVSRYAKQPPHEDPSVYGRYYNSQADGDDSTPGDIYGQVRACDQHKEYYRKLSETVAAERAEASKNVKARAYGRIDQDIWGAKQARPEHWAHDEDDK